MSTSFILATSIPGLQFHRILSTNKKNMHRPHNLTSSLPYDIALKIASSLQAIDVCSLGSCSRFWRDLCVSDCVWEGLCKDRWPALFPDDNASHQHEDIPMPSNSEGWRDLYKSKHKEMVWKARIVRNFVERALAYESIEVGTYLKALELLNVHQFGFKDIQMYLLKPDLNVLLNLIGLHYCVVWLQIPAKDVVEALSNNKIADRRVSIQWWKLGRWFYGFRLRDELHARNVSLQDLALSSEEIFGVLHRGAIHEVIRVQISAAKPVLQSWSCQA